MKSIHTTIIICVTAIICVAIFSGQMVTARTARNSVISVTGSATQSFTSDLIVWRGSFSKSGRAIRDAFSQLQDDMRSIKKYLTDNGVDESEIVFSSVQINRNHSTEFDGNVRRTIFTGYTLTQNVTIRSKEVDKIEAISRDITALIDIGVELISQPPEYYYTKLDELRLDLIAKSAENTRKRAEIIARESGSEIKKLRNANLGVFQITPQYSSTEFTFGGAFDVRSKDKTAFITTRMEFLLK